MRKRILVLGVLVLAAAAASVLYFRRSDQKAGTAIAVSGNIELTEVNIAFKA